MGNIFCQRLGIMGESFEEKKTVKVSGVSQFLQEQITMEFQRKENSASYTGDVNKLHVCPKGRDYVLVEFVKDIPGESVGDVLKIGGTKLKVEQCNVQSSNEDVESYVSQIWPVEGTAIIRAGNSRENFPLSNGEKSTHRNGGKDNRSKNDKNGRKEARQQKHDQGRHGLNLDLEAPFSETKAKLNDHLAKKMEKDDFKEMLKEEDVKLEKGYLSGTWNAICTVGQKLLSYIPGPGPDQSSASRTVVDQSPQNNRPDESFTVNSLFLRYIMAYHYEQLEKIENVCEEISFKTKKSEKEVRLFIRTGVDKALFSKSVNDFINFYQDQNQKMYQEICVAHTHDVSEVCSKFSVVVSSSLNLGNVTIYGEKDNVGKAKDFLQSKVNGSNRDNNPSTDPLKGTTTKEALNKKLSCELSKNVKLIVYQGDLTQEKVDAIVNPANGRLDHGGGAALAIVKAGGRSIQEESNRIMKDKRYIELKPGEVTKTGSGKLPCKFVVHAVGPMWEDYAPETVKVLLYNAVYHSLGLSCHHAAKSISIPAISSGVYKVPITVCAQVLFDAVINFTKEADESMPLKEIRFVNIDYATYRTFAKEMELRFGGSVKHERIEGVPLKDSEKPGRSTKNAQQTYGDFSRLNPGFRQGSASGQSTNVTCKGGQSHPSGDHGSTGDNPSANHQQSPKTFRSYSEAAAAGKKSNKNDPKLGNDAKSSKDDNCPICLCEFIKKKTLDKCGHTFCSDCIKNAFKVKKVCPVCSTVYGPLIGNQPDGKMIESYRSTSLPGYKTCGTIVISYRFDGGIQGPNHPNPGKPYPGTSRTAYLPDNAEGRKVLKLLKKAFEQKLTFTIGRSTTSGANDVITWNDIHHKTNTMGGATSFGYPDFHYLKRVQDELAAKGITEYTE